MDATVIAAYSQKVAAGETFHLTTFAPYGIDTIARTESFRHEIENGVDTSSKELPTTLEFNSISVGGSPLLPGFYKIR